MNGKLITACILSLVLTACSSDGKTTASTDSARKNTATIMTDTDKSKSVAMVNGKAISEELFDAYSRQRRSHLQADVSRKQLLDEFINFELVIQDALAKRLEEKAEVANDLQLQRRNILASAAFREHMKENPLTEEQMREDYETRLADLTFTEYKLRHILTENEAGATKALTELNNGGDIHSLVKKYSSDPSLATAGDIGWQTESELLPTIRDKVRNLKKGEHAKESIKTQFGWHVVYMEDRRDNPPPPFEEVKERVREVMQRHRIEEYIVSLRSEAKIEFPQPAELMPQQHRLPAEPGAQPGIMMNNY